MGTLLRILLLFELVAYVASAFICQMLIAWPWQYSVLTSVVAPFLLRSGLIVWSFNVARRHSPDKTTRHWLRAFLSEWLPPIAFVSIYGPFERLFFGRERITVARDGQPPVLLVHGYAANRGIWWRFMRKLRARGLSVYTINLNPAFGDIDRLAMQLAARIDAIASGSGAAKVHVIAHSMGGLVARRMRCLLPEVALGQLITIGTPHQGTLAADIGIGPAARQMRHGSPWLAALAHSESRCPPLAALNIYSLHDNIVIPAERARVHGVESLELSELGHLALIDSAIVADAVINRCCVPLVKAI
jgi:triacylglycerol lipase